MKYKIVLVPFPFDDFTNSKVRPAICLTPTISKFEHIIIAFITSRIEIADEKSDLLLRKTIPEFYLTGLKIDSAIRLHRLVTVPKRIILRELGELPEAYKEQLRDKVLALFDFEF
ncbi:MAG: type II toxin-antitoxin system PemK/MazF family toxin [Bacteroidota bacterium]